MNKKVNIIGFILIGFILNIFFYLFSDNYRYFLQSLKYDDTKYTINDKFKIEIPDIEQKNKDHDINNNIFSGLSKNFGEDEKNSKNIDNSKFIKEKKDILKNIDNKFTKENKSEFISFREKIKLTNIENNILKAFVKYNLKKIEVHPRLFDLTGEYPNEYFEYYSPDINLYFFGNKSYDDIKDIFEVLTYELPFKISEINNFGIKSFYINLDPLFEDSYVRIVLKKSNRTFGLKIKKELYNKIKNDLAVIFEK